jgi:hypothetical protein
MAVHLFHSVISVNAKRYSRGSSEWLDVRICEEEHSGTTTTSLTIFVKDAALADRLVAAINAAQVFKIEEAA